MRATIIIDNISKNELISEWGLAVFIEYEGQKVLLDTGATGEFVKNAKALGIDLEEVSYGVLSHAHFDHSDGLADFFECNQKASFYLREGAKENCYDKIFFFHKYIGIHKGFLEKYKERISYVSGDYRLFAGVSLLPHKAPGLEQIGKKAKMYQKAGRRWIPDNFNHEQSLVFETEKGLVIFNSCSHGGADNIITEVAMTYPGKNIYALIGGFHLYATPIDEVRKLANRIKATGIQKVITGHCTGKRAYQILKDELGDAVEQMYTGMVIEI